ncbi:Calx-beta domain-containing protein [Shewanella mangrovisoli]|uniref:Calx-beta domain-containing protein n=1 Tax=Shewanella mangrovisoli TaxID=2864211 RepID=UPI0035BA4E0F
MNQRYIALALPFVVLSAKATDIRPLAVNEVHNQILSPIALSNNADTVADVVVFYQPSFYAKYGEYAALKRIEAWFDIANDSYKAHGTNFKLNIADVLPVESIGDDIPFDDVSDASGKIIQDGAEYLFSLAVLNAGSAEYAAYQTKWKGDLVVYVREMRPNDTVLGRASIGGEMSSVLDDGRLPQQFTALAHEIGHNIGMNHEAAKANIGPDYARAWECGGKQTIMYSSSSASTTLLHYSSPELFNGGMACGDSKLADNARILKENFPSVTTRREGVASIGKVRFANTVFSGNETDGINVTLIRDGDLTQAASVKVFAENGSAIWGSDFLESHIIAHFAVGSDTTTVTYPIVKDTHSEGVEDFTLNLKFPYKLTADKATAQVKIQDGNQTGYAGLFSIDGASLIDEGESAQFVITRVGGTGEVVVNVKAVSGTATTGNDYVDLNQNVLFAEGQTSATVTLNTIDDIEYKSSKTLKLIITAASDNAEYDVQELPITIIDNDPVPTDQGIFALSVGASSVSESIGSLILTITRTDGDASAVSMHVATQDGTAKAGIDYQSIDQTVTFADGETSKTLSVNIIGNSSVDGSRTFTVNLSGEATITTPSITLTITDDNSANNGQNGNDSNESSGGSLGGLGILLLSVTALFRRKQIVE